ncbi:hypothetical protein KIN20_038461 [Parelaphostrongylus tenuis]|uniref:Uncharacterized protein n=1 Tax=Parelaphostrongylus tenuis TaxID=148309 RepID=A0AAD5RBD6_PARTN|nr:hypothetical protein KIN20_038461 [Parelaphostrongylus tenuis]
MADHSAVVCNLKQIGRVKIVGDKGVKVHLHSANSHTWHNGRFKIERIGPRSFTSFLILPDLAFSPLITSSRVLTTSSTENAITINLMQKILS